VREVFPTLKLFVSNGLLDARYTLRSCIVNFRICADDVEAMLDVIAPLGRALDGELHSDALR
jgi:hypothetical protein